MAASGVLVALRIVASESGVDKAASLVDLHTSTIATNDVVDTGVDIGSAKNHLAHLLTITGCDADWDGEFLGNLGRHTDFVDT